MNKNLLYNFIIIFLILTLFGVLVLSYNVYNNGIDGTDYIIDTESVKCNETSMDITCNMDRIYTNGTRIGIVLQRNKYV